VSPYRLERIEDLSPLPTGTGKPVPSQPIPSSIPRNEPATLIEIELNIIAPGDPSDSFGPASGMPLSPEMDFNIIISIQSYDFIQEQVPPILNMDLNITTSIQSSESVGQENDMKTTFADIMPPYQIIDQTPATTSDYYIPQNSGGLSMILPDDGSTAPYDPDNW
jgi:hypothetical protein